MSKNHIVMVEVLVEGCDSLDEANRLVRGWLNERALPRTSPRRLLQAEVLTDFEVDNSNQRVFYAHPEDTHQDYDADEYEKKLEAERADDENSDS